MALERRVPEPARQRAIYPGHRQRISPRLSPGLPRSKSQELRKSARSRAVVRALTRAVIEEEIAVVYARADQELPDSPSALREASVRPIYLAQQAQHQLGMQVLA